MTADIHRAILLQMVSAMPKILPKFLKKLEPVGRAPAAVLAAALMMGSAWVASAVADTTTIKNCDKSDYLQCLLGWKADRLHFLKSKTGYLNLAGLYWLKPGKNSFGAGAENDLVFPGTADSSIGIFDLVDGAVWMRTHPDLGVTYNGTPVSELLIAGDKVSEPVTASLGSLAWTVIERDGRFAVRLRDFENPALLNFPVIEYFPVSQEFRVKAILHRYEKPRVIHVGTFIEGLSYNPQSPGVVKFAINDQTFELEAYGAGDELFFVFGDQTSGRGSYPAGRFLYAKMPTRDGLLELDFNTAHSPPCAYNEFATCPVASPRNRLATRITAGEQYRNGQH